VSAAPRRLEGRGTLITGAGSGIGATAAARLTQEGAAVMCADIDGARARLDILVNSAGFTRDRSLLKMSDEEWQSVIDVHLRGTWLGCQHVATAMRAGNGGAIVNLASESRHGSFGQVNYAAAKAGVVGLTRTVALEHARHGIRATPSPRGWSTPP
jgi:3-oxoacyl-[acyl-carrier protein] reductase